MKVTDILKDWENFSNFVIDRVAGENTEELTQAEIDEINEGSARFLDEVGIDRVLSKAKRLSNLNILDKKVNFKEVEKFPHFWRIVYPAEIDVVAVENSQAIMGR